MNKLIALLVVAAVSAACLAQDSASPTTKPTTAPTTEPAKDPNAGKDPAPGAPEKVTQLPGGGKVSVVTHGGGRLTNWRPPGARGAKVPATQPATQPTTEPTGVCPAPVSVSSLSSNEQSEMVKAAKCELERLRVPVGKREATTTLDGDVVTVEFPPPQGMRAGSFIIKLDRKTKKVLDTKIWR